MARVDLVQEKAHPGLAAVIAKLKGGRGGAERFPGPPSRFFGPPPSRLRHPCSYDDEFEERGIVSSTFARSMDTTLELASDIRETRFRNRVWFYSTLVALSDAFTGIPGGKGPANLVPKDEIGRRMKLMHEALRHDDVSHPSERLRTALARGTSHVPERRIRHEQFFLMLTAPRDEWLRAFTSLG